MLCFEQQLQHRLIRFQQAVARLQGHLVVKLVQLAVRQPGLSVRKQVS